MSKFSARSARRLAQAIKPRFEVLEDRAMPSCNVIAGFVYLDANNNGLRDPGESPVAGSTLELHNATGTVIATTVTDSAGHYQFDTDGTVATADLQTHAVLFPEAKTNTPQSAAVPQFDPALGTLTGVEIIVNGHITSDISVENVDDHPTSIVGNVSGTLTISGPRFATIVTTSVQSESINAGAFDGAVDFAGVSGVKFGAETVNGSKTLSLTSPSDLSPYIGTGTVSIREDAQASSSSSGGGNLVTQISSHGGAEVTLIYHYTPNNCLKPGNYSIVQSPQPAGLLDGKESRAGTVLPGSVGKDQISVTLLNADLENNNFGELNPARIKGIVYADNNDSGGVDAGEQGIGNAEVRLTGIDDTGEAVAINLQTTPDGRFIFKGLRPGIYTLAETQPAGWLDGKDTLGTQGGTRTNDQFANITLAPGAAARQYRFGELRPVSFAGFVFVDGDDDGLRERGEGGIASVLITLSGIDDRGQAIFLEARTSADGSYRFDNLRPGLYMLQETQPDGYRDGKDTPGSLGGTTTNDALGEIAARPGDSGVEYNFAELPAIIVLPAATGGKIDFTGTNDPRR